MKIGNLTFENSVFLAESNNPDKIIQMDKDDYYKYAYRQTTYTI